MLDIGSNGEWPSSSLSNFAAHALCIDGVACASMEGFLQSLKFEDEARQVEICQLVGRKAKYAGLAQPWYETQLLYWQGVKYDRRSRSYQQLLDRAYQALAKNGEFQAALLATGDEVLDHRIGKENPERTVLTRLEFINRLLIIRRQLQLTQYQCIEPFLIPTV